MSIATDVRSYADLAITQSKSALSQAGSAFGQAGVTAGKLTGAAALKPAYVAIGVADLLAATVTKRLEELPVDAVTGVAKAQQTSQGLLNRAQAEALSTVTDLRTRVDAGVDTVTGLPDTAKSAGEAYLNTARSTGGAYLGTAKSLFDAISQRGEKKASEFRKDRRVAKVLGTLDGALATVPVTVSAKSAFEKASSAVTSDGNQPAKAATRTRKATALKPARTAPASKPAARTTAAKKAPVKKAPVKKAPVTKAPARKAPARKAPAKAAK